MPNFTPQDENEDDLLKRYLAASQAPQDMSVAPQYGDQQAGDFLGQLQDIKRNPLPAAPAPVQAAPRVPAIAPQQPNSDSDVVKNYIASLPQNMPSFQDFAGAQQASRNNLRNVNVGEGLSDVAHALSGANTKAPSFDDLRQSANQPSQQVADQAKYATQLNELDPNSPSAMTFKKLIADQYKIPVDQLAPLPLSQVKELNTILQGKTALETKKIIADTLAQSRGGAFSFKDKQLQDRQHEQVVKRFDTDPVLKKQLGQLTGIYNSLSEGQQAFNENKPITREQFQAIQQGVLNSLALQGVTSKAERTAKLLDSFGIEAKDKLQFLSGEPQSIGADNPLYKHIKDLARWSSANVISQYKDQLENLKSGHTFYDPESDNYRPDLAKALEGKIERLKKTAGNRQFVNDASFKSSPVANAGGASGAPEVGAIEDGHRFKGGDPADPSNWEKQ